MARMFLLRDSANMHDRSFLPVYGEVWLLYDSLICSSRPQSKICMHCLIMLCISWRLRGIGEWFCIPQLLELLAVSAIFYLSSSVNFRLSCLIKKILHVPKSSTLLSCLIRKNVMSPNHLLGLAAWSEKLFTSQNHPHGLAAWSEKLFTSQNHLHGLADWAENLPSSQK